VEGSGKQRHIVGTSAIFFFPGSTLVSLEALYDLGLIGVLNSGSSHIIFVRNKQGFDP
jgi:hypothetical protein